MANDILLDASAIAAAAANNALATLPTAEPLVASPPATEMSPMLGLHNLGGAVIARFTGAASGEVLIAVEQQVVDALQNSPLGSLDLAAALTPALTEAANAVGTVSLGPVQSIDTITAVESLLSKPNSAVVPLSAAGIVRAVVGVEIAEVVEVPEGAPAADGLATPEFPSTDDLRKAHLGSGDPGRRTGLELLRDVAMEVTAQIGSTRMTISELLSLADGAVIELDRAAGAPADLLVNGHLIARGEVVVIDENFGLRITELITDPESVRA